MTAHELKTWPEPFAAILDGGKTYEIRRADRPFKVGDRLRLMEWEPWQGCANGGGRYTGREVIVEVTYLTPGGDFGLPMDLCVMAIRRVPEDSTAHPPPECESCAGYGSVRDPADDTRRECVDCRGSGVAP